MLKRYMKYNPAFLAETELMQSFLARRTDFEMIVKIIRDNVTASNQHVLVIGPRGSGKTMLILRIAAEVRSDHELSAHWYPIIFAEESYEVSSAGEFWLEALFHLGEQTKENAWSRTYEELKKEQNNTTLRERACAQLMDFADRAGKRLILIVENLNMLLNSQINSDEAWSLRHTLLNEPRIMLLATATSRFEEIENSSSAMFELFKIHELKPLDEEECQAIWTYITGIKAKDDRIRPIQILTGGNPRLLAIISGFGAKLSLKELMEDLINMVDDHTEYFKSYLDNLPPVERKVYLALSDLWDPATAKEVAQTARLDVNKTSSLLNRLIGRGAVKVIDGAKKAKWYQVTERMYNIYHLMRRRGGPSSRVKAVVKFMVSFYSHRDLVTMTRLIAEEACHVKPELSVDHCLVYEGILKNVHSPKIVQKIVDSTPRTFFESSHISPSLKELITEGLPQQKPASGLSRNKRGADRGKPKEMMTEQSAIADTRDEKQLFRMIKRARALSAQSRMAPEAVKFYQKIIEKTPMSIETRVEFAEFCRRIGRYEEAEAAYRKIIELGTEKASAWVWAQLGELLHEKLNRYEEAEVTYRKAIELDPEYAWVWAQLGELFHEKLNRYEEAEAAYRKAVELDPEYTRVLAQLGELFHEKLNRYEEAETAYRKIIALGPEKASAWAWVHLGWLFHEKLNRYEEAEAAYRKGIELNPNYHWVWAHFGALLHEELNQYEEAELAYRKAIELDAFCQTTWAHLGELFHEQLNRYEEAEAAYRKAIELEPKYEWAWAKLGWLLHDKLNRYEDAETAYRKAIELEPKYEEAWVKLGWLLHDKLNRYEDAEAAYRKAIELNPANHWVWEQFGRLLHEGLNRYEEAEAAYRKAIELDSTCHTAWGVLGQLLHEELNRYEEAETAYRKSIKIDPAYEWTWASLGQLLHKDLNRYEEAETAYRKTIELEPNWYEAWDDLLLLLIRQEGRKEETLHMAQKALLLNQKNASFYNSLAWTFYKEGRPEFLNDARAMASQATKLSPDNAIYQHTLACIMIAQHKGKQALKAAEKYLQDVALVEKCLDDAIDLFIGLAALGYAKQVLDLLLNSPSSIILEPLIVGLRLFVGEDVKCAVEIMEVAMDIVKKIQQMEKK